MKTRSAAKASAWRQERRRGGKPRTERQSPKPKKKKKKSQNDSLRPAETAEGKEEKETAAQPTGNAWVEPAWRLLLVRESSAMSGEHDQYNPLLHPREVPMLLSMRP